MTKNLRFSVTVVSMFLIISFGITANEYQNIPVAISPGSDTETVEIWQSCPTFSWSAVDQSASYRLSVFEVVNPKVTLYEDMAAMSTPVISQEIPGPALSWTLPAKTSLKTGSMYAWYIQALDADGNTLGQWSTGKLLKVNQEIRFAGIEEKLGEILRDYGVSEETVTDVLKDLKSEVKEVVVRGSGSNGAMNSTEWSGIKGYEGIANTFYGLNSGFSNTSGTGDTFVGANAGYSNTTGIDNTFIGRVAGRNNTVGGNNTFVGQAAGYQNTSGNYNTFIGYMSGFKNIAGGDNTFIGDSTGSNNIGSYNTFIGKDSGYSNTGGGNNIFIGKSAGSSNSTGCDNTFLGSFAGYSNTTANNNIFIGGNSGYSNTTGYDNIFIGIPAGYNNTEGNDNIFFGSAAGFSNNIGSYNIFFGDSSGNWNTTGSWNTFIGNGTGRCNKTGIKNVFLGNNAGYLNSSGQGNVFIGFSSGYNETGSNKLYIANSDTSSPLIHGQFDNKIVTVNGKLGINTKTPGWLIEVDSTGSNAAIAVKRTDGATNLINATQYYAQFGATTNHPVRILVNYAWKMSINTNGSLSMANGATCTSGGVWTNASSRYLKENIERLSSDEALDALNDLNPVKYNYKVDKTDHHVGFIAEDVPELVATSDRKGMSPMDVVAVLTKVVQEQQKIISALQERIADIEKTKNTDY